MTTCAKTLTILTVISLITCILLACFGLKLEAFFAFMVAAFWAACLSGEIKG